MASVGSPLCIGNETVSIRAFNWALGTSTGKSTAKLVLLVLANYADDDGICWPSQKRVARESEQSVDSVQRRLRDLERDGLIERERRNGRNGARSTDRYHLRMDPKPQSAVLDHGTRKKGDLSRRANEPKPQLCGLDIDEPSIEPSIKQPRYEQGTNKGLASKSKQRTYLNNQRPTQRDQGTFESEIANRLGSNGWDILLDLPETEVNHLCLRQRRGTLDDETIARLRAGVPP